jgi:hypothetical protein
MVHDTTAERIIRQAGAGDLERGVIGGRGDRQPADRRQVS